MLEQRVSNPMAFDEREVIPAATVVIFRDADPGPPELLMVQRSRKLRFAGGAAVFPGGKVDPADYDLAAQLRSDEDTAITAARVAAIRETLEETGLLIGVHQPVSSVEAAEARAMLLNGGDLASVLDRFGWTLDLGRLAFYAHWCAPSMRAFDTLFFIFDLGTGAVDLTVDATENTKLFWVSAANALEMADNGGINVIFPTRRNLERLERSSSFEETLRDISLHPVARICPSLVVQDGQTWLVIPEGQGYPVLGQPLATTERG